MNKKGLTVIELLMATAIYIIVAGMLMQHLGKARDMGRRTHCMNNLRFLGLAMELYTADWDGFTPAVMDSDGNGIMYVTLNTYLQNHDVFWCPTSVVTRKWDGAGAPLSAAGVSYGFNYNGTGNNSGYCNDRTSNAYTRSIKDVHLPYDVIVATDSYSDSLEEFSVFYSPGDWSAGPGDLHSLGANALFADGHIKWYAQSVLRENMNWWNYDNSDTDY